MARAQRDEAQLPYPSQAPAFGLPLHSRKRRLSRSTLLSPLTGLAGGLGALACFGFLALVAVSAAVTAVKLSADQLAGAASNMPSPKPKLANIDDKCPVFMASP